MRQEELDIILENHKHWLNKDCIGWETMRADLSHMHLCNMNLSGVDLREAYLRGVDFSDSNLSHARLCGADLLKAVFYHTNLEFANLSDAILAQADIFKSNLCYSNFSGAKFIRTKCNLTNCFHTDFTVASIHRSDFFESNLEYALLHGASLIGTTFTKANLKFVDFSYTNIKGAVFDGAENMPYIPMACPSDGAFIGWKKVRNRLVKLQIPEDARRCSATTNKCRCDKALVLGIYNLDGENSGLSKITNIFHGRTSRSIVVYKVGEMVYPDRFEEDRWKECAPGIHFFINKEEAINYNNN